MPYKVGFSAHRNTLSGSLKVNEHIFVWEEK